MKTIVRLLPLLAGFALVGGCCSTPESVRLLSTGLKTSSGKLAADHTDSYSYAQKVTQHYADFAAATRTELAGVLAAHLEAQRALVHQQALARRDALVRSFDDQAWALLATEIPERLKSLTEPRFLAAIEETTKQITELESDAARHPRDAPSAEIAALKLKKFQLYALANQVEYASVVQTAADLKKARDTYLQRVDAEMGSAEQKALAGLPAMPALTELDALVTQLKARVVELKTDATAFAQAQANFDAALAELDGYLLRANKVVEAAKAFAAGFVKGAFGEQACDRSHEANRAAARRRRPDVQG